MIFTIAARELRAAFLSPIAWILIGVSQIILAFILGSGLENYVRVIQPQLHLYLTPPDMTSEVIVPQYMWLAIIMIVVSPLLSMRVFSDERKNKTLTLLVSAPVSMTEIVVGKYLGLLTIVGIMLATFTVMPLCLLFFGSIDFGLLFSAMLGVFLLMASCMAIGLYMSSLTQNPLISAMLSFFLILLLSILIFAQGESPNQFSLADLSLFQHLMAFVSGLFSSHDLIYYLLLIGICLILAVHRLDSDRLQH
jgi:ABC-2 type transport system permease protein